MNPEYALEPTECHGMREAQELAHTLEGSLDDRFREAFRRARELNSTLLAEPEFPPEFRVREGAWEVFLNDRLGFPNSDESDTIVRPGLAAALGAAPESLKRHSDPHGRLGYSVRL